MFHWEFRKRLKRPCSNRTCYSAQVEIVRNAPEFYLCKTEEFRTSNIVKDIDVLGLK